MTTINTVIAQVDTVKPNAYADEDKYRWINQLEGLLSVEVFRDEVPLYLDFPADGDRPLRVAHPYDELYSLYLMAMIDFSNREYASFNNTLLLFRERLEQLKAQHIRTRRPVPAAGHRKVMG